MATPEPGRAARVPPTQGHGHAGGQRTTARGGGQGWESRGGPRLSPRLARSESSLRHRKWGPHPHPLTSGAGSERCWARVWGEGECERECDSAEVGMTRGPRLGASKDLTFSGLGYLHLLGSSRFCPELSASWVLGAAVLATCGAAAASSPRGLP